MSENQQLNVEEDLVTAFRCIANQVPVLRLLITGIRSYDALSCVGTCTYIPTLRTYLTLPNREAILARWMESLYIAAQIYA
jgi:hypothetical protein